MHPRDTHVEFTGKNKLAVPREQNYAAWLVKNGKTVFSKLTHIISLLVSGEQASRQAGKQVLALQFSFFRILDTFQPFRLLF